jgi:regulatory protein
VTQTPTLKARAIAALARREFSRAQLARKLAPFAQSESEVQEVLQTLEEKKLLSNQRFAESLSRQRARKYGTARIVAELQLQGVPEDIVRAQSAELKATELQRAFEAWQKRFGLPPDSPKARAQQMRFLLARGFSSQVFYQLASQGFAAPTAPSSCVTKNPPC